MNVVSKRLVVGRLLSGNVADQNQNNGENKFDASCQKSSRGLDLMQKHGEHESPRAFSRNLQYSVLLRKGAATRYIDVLFHAQLRSHQS